MTEAIDSVAVTDVHAHVLLPALHEEVQRRAADGVRAAAELELLRNGAESLAVSGPMVGARIPKLTDVRVRLADMDAQGVQRQWASYLRRIWFDTVVHDPHDLRTLVEVAGGSQVLLGSDYPFDMGLDDPVTFVRGAGLPAELAARILGGNAQTLLKALVHA
ncbi:amidohydrolase [Microbacterium sp. zg.B48]|uniref:amidohydrolase n=1 Tax=unclassified Microbacterium TaxID=2609290 RepID=UPI00214C4A5E|nr:MULTISPECIES: amidohydrolase [unclassified Microbacterium]MCR2762967.1 amidohydrolase [Microbacterium sp. zg.B48]MCR2808553.1 amidohydrolase [Microbacterium sp. zg.B185]WIM19008.1 amidohydrolase [Microbacterium sp. zg-B185]